MKNKQSITQSKGNKLSKLFIVATTVFVSGTLLASPLNNPYTAGVENPIPASIQVITKLSNKNVNQAKIQLQEAIKSNRFNNSPQSVLVNLRKAKQVLNLGAHIGPMKIKSASDYVASAIQTLIEEKQPNAMKGKLRKVIQNIKLGKLSYKSGLNGKASVSLFKAKFLLRQSSPIVDSFSHHQKNRLQKAFNKIKSALQIINDSYTADSYKVSEVNYLTNEAVQLILNSKVFQKGGGVF